jgi:hypothetical protein
VGQNEGWGRGAGRIGQVFISRPYITFNIGPQYSGIYTYQQFLDLSYYLIMPC